jgi:hypothetical protein
MNGLVDKLNNKYIIAVMVFLFVLSLAMSLFGRKG